MGVTTGGFETLTGESAGAEEIASQATIPAPVAASATGVAAAVGLTGSAQSGITAGITSPDVPRNVTVKGNASGIAGNVVIHGTNGNNEVITETIALNGATEVVGNKAFKTVTSYDLPAKTNSSGDTVSIGLGSKLGIGVKLSRDTVLRAYINNVKEGTAPTVAFSATVLESNTALLNTSIPGSQDVILYFIED